MYDHDDESPFLTVYLTDAEAAYQGDFEEHDYLVKLDNHHYDDYPYITDDWPGRDITDVCSEKDYWSEDEQMSMI